MAAERPVEYLDLDDLLNLAEALLGPNPPIRDAGLLGSAAARPQTSVGGEDAYPDVWTKAAALLDSVVNNHALVDGNKRLGWLATAVFLHLNGIDVSVAANDSVYDLVMDVAGGHRTVDEVAEHSVDSTTGGAEPDSATSSSDAGRRARGNGVATRQSRRLSRSR